MEIVTEAVLELLETRLQLQHRLVVATCLALTKLNLKCEQDDYVATFLVPLNLSQMVWEEISRPSAKKKGGEKSKMEEDDEPDEEQEIEDQEKEEEEEERIDAQEEDDTEDLPEWIPEKCDKKVCIKAYCLIKVFTHIWSSC